MDTLSQSMLQKTKLGQIIRPVYVKFSASVGYPKVL